MPSGSLTQFNERNLRLKGPQMIRVLATDEAILSTPCMPVTVEDAELAADLIDHCGGRYV